MSQFRMNGPGRRQEPDERPKLWRRAVGWTLMVVSVPITCLLVPVAVFLTLMDGVGYVAGYGEPVTVTVVKSSQEKFNGPDESGEGYYLRDGERRYVELDDVTKGQRVEARLAVSDDADDEKPRAYPGFGSVFSEVSFRTLLACIFAMIGVWLWRGGAALAAWEPKRVFRRRPKHSAHHTRSRSSLED